MIPTVGTGLLFGDGIRRLLSAGRLGVRLCSGSGRPTTVDGDDARMRPFMPFARLIN